MLIPLLMIAGAYLLGSLSTAIVVCRVIGATDPREAGSRNPGATNVLRIAGKGPAAVTLLGDSAKGLIPVLIGHALGLDATWLAAIALAAFLGHLYPLYYGFEGGKGVATFIGVTLALNPWMGASFVGIWLVVALALRVRAWSSHQRAWARAGRLAAW